MAHVGYASTETILRTDTSYRDVHGLSGEKLFCTIRNLLESDPETAVLELVGLGRVVRTATGSC
jgi:hypothetical protein